MKKSEGFWQSLEKYSWKVLGRSPLPWAWVGIGVIMAILLASALNTKNSVVGAENINEVIGRAARLGDYGLARGIYESGGERVLGAESELEDLVYPERVIERKIGEIEEKLKEYPGNREIYLMLTNLYTQVGDEELAGEYGEKARVLDPNN